MKRTSAVVLALFLLTMTSCRTWSGQHYVGSQDYLLTTRVMADGTREDYHLKNGALQVHTESERERPFLGFKVSELTKPRAERRGVRPYTGLLINGVYPESSAANAGVLKNDVLLSIDGEELVYLSQLAEAEARLRDGQTCTAAVLRGQERIDVPLLARVVVENVTDRQDIPLEKAPPTPRPYAGVTLRGIPAVWCERIFGEARNAVVVTDVEVGSPAWLAGIRGGDVIDTVDGEPVPPVAELSRRIAAGGEVNQTMRWQVRRGEGLEHDAEVHLHDYSGEGHFWLPLVTHITNGTFEDRWSVGPFGLLMSNRNHYVPETSTRMTQTRNVFSMLLGLFRVESSPRETEVRLLYFIRFDT